MGIWNIDLKQSILSDNLGRRNSAIWKTWKKYGLVLTGFGPLNIPYPTPALKAAPGIECPILKVRLRKEFSNLSRSLGSPGPKWPLHIWLDC